jgi:hypothetical protein
VPVLASRRIDRRMWISEDTKSPRPTSAGKGLNPTTSPELACANRLVLFPLRDFRTVTPYRSPSQMPSVAARYRGERRFKKKVLFLQFRPIALGQVNLPRQIELPQAAIPMASFR